MVNGEIKNGKLILIVDVDAETLKAAQPSSSGKTLVVGTTNGFSKFGNVSVSLNVTVPNPDYVKAPK